MIPRIIHQTSPHLTPEEARLGKAMRAPLPDWQYRLWDDHANEGLVETHFKDYASRFRSIKRGVVKADLARYMYLSAYGGFYFDTDYKLVSGIGDDILNCTCVLPISRDSDSVFRLGNAVMASEAGHPFWASFIEHVFSNFQLAGLAEKHVEKTTGPEGLTDFYLANQARFPDITLPIRERFHPQLRLSGFLFDKRPTTIGAHLCWGSWRTKGPLGIARAIAVRKLTSLY